MNTTTVVGPLKTESEAIETANSLGQANHSVYSRSVKDSGGFDTDERQWFVERDNNAIGKVMGYDWQHISAMQQRRA